MSKLNTGPYLKINKQINEANSQFPLYTICQVNKAAILANEAANAALLTSKDNGANSSIAAAAEKLPKDKAPQVIDVDGPWTCAFCSHSVYFKNFCMGNLFGPYRIYEEEEEDEEGKESKLSGEKEQHSSPNSIKKENSLKFQEIWLHKSCAIWYIFFYLFS